MRGGHRYTLPLDGRRDPDLESARLFAAGAIGVWVLDDRVIGWFDHRTPEVPAGGTWVLEEDRDWQAEWKAGIRPVRAGDVLVVPTWLRSQSAPEPDDVVVVLDPGRAFGSGHHATTLQCLELLQVVGPEGRAVLDVGTGTGVLAIAAAKLGARTVVGIDTDPEAVAIATENAARNGVTATFTHGSLETVDREHDVVLANLTTDTLVTLAGDLAAVTIEAGSLIASGVAEERAGSTLAALAEHGFERVELRRRDGWAALLATKGGS